MSLATTASNAVSVCVKKYGFESSIFVLLVLYTLFYCTPSSYGVALKSLGIPNNGLIYGTPKPIRSDEWAVWTPYLQSLVNNHFQRFNALSIYHEDFRNFNALPIYDWALFFKPQFWSFLIAEPARAFSFHHGFLIATFIIGWKQLLEKILQPYPYTSSGVAIGFTLLLFFSGFIQTFWTTVGPVIAFLPWVLIVLLSWAQHSIRYYVLLTYIVTVWMLSHTYPPLVISSAYVGLFMLGAFQTDFFLNGKRFVFSALACSVAALIAIYYYKDILTVMMDTVYPGKRIATGGGGRFYWWLNTIVPYLTHSSNGITITRRLNICEATAVSSLLPLMSLCFADIKKTRDLYGKDVAVLIGACVFFTSWWLLPVPLLLGKLLLLTNVTEHRLAFALGLTVNMLALVVLVKYGARLNLKRLLTFTALLFLCWYLPAIAFHFNFFPAYDAFKKSTKELITLPLMAMLLVLARYQWINKRIVIQSIVFAALLPNMLYFATFNPLQSAQPIFTAKNSEQVAHLKALEQQDSRGWLIFPNIRGAVLNGLGLKSFSHTLIQPQLAFFRALFPELPPDEFNQLFNRYAHIELAYIQTPDSPHPDVIRIPIKKITGEAADLDVTVSVTDCNSHAIQSGMLEKITFNNKNKILYLNGRVSSNERRYLSNLKSSQLIRYSEQSQLGIAPVNVNNLPSSGFRFEIMLSNDDIELMRQEGFCLLSDSSHSGVKKIVYFSREQVASFMQSNSNN
jgi:hypothetical protein